MTGFVETWLGLFRSTAGVALRSFRTTFFGLRFLVTAIALGFFLVLWALLLGGASAATPPNPAPVWSFQADGALAAFAFGFIPLFLPFLPLLTVHDSVRRDRETGFMEAIMTRPIPRWSAGLGIFAGLFLAVGVWVLLVDVLSLGFILVTSQSSVSGGLAGAFILGTLLLAALYIALALCLSAFLPRARATGVALLMWLLFNVIRPTGLTIVGQFFLILQIREPLSFRTSLSDLGTFTGFYDGFLALSVPDSLSFIVRPDIANLSSGIAYAGVPLVGPVVLLFLIALYLFFLMSAPLGK